MLVYIVQNLLTCFEHIKFKINQCSFLSASVLSHSTLSQALNDGYNYQNHKKNPAEPWADVWLFYACIRGECYCNQKANFSNSPVSESSELLPCIVLIIYKYIWSLNDYFFLSVACFYLSGLKAKPFWVKKKYLTCSVVMNLINSSIFCIFFFYSTGRYNGGWEPFITMLAFWSWLVFELHTSISNFLHKARELFIL